MVSILASTATVVLSSPAGGRRCEQTGYPSVAEAPPPLVTATSNTLGSSNALDIRGMRAARVSTDARARRASPTEDQRVTTVHSAGSSSAAPAQPSRWPGLVARAASAYAAVRSNSRVASAGIRCRVTTRIGALRC
jgi:hypothetical protein